MNLQNRISAVIAARNAVYDAQQRYADGTAGMSPLADALDVTRRDIADDLYEATYKLIHRIDNMIDSVEWQNMILGLDNDAGGDR